MEIRSTTISFSKGKAQAIRKHEAEIKQQLDELDKIICNSQNLDNIDEILKQYDDLKKELQHQYENKGKAAIFRSKCRWVEEGEKATKYSHMLSNTPHASHCYHSYGHKKYIVSVVFKRSIPP